MIRRVGLTPAQQRDEAFIATYRICSVRGRLYGRKMLIDVLALRLRYMTITRAEVIAAIDDDAFMRRHAGEVPSAVADGVLTYTMSGRAHGHPSLPFPAVA